MSEFERLLQLIVSLQILFGSRRGNIGVPLLILALVIGGWFIYRSWYDPSRVLERADACWDTGDSKQRIEAIRQYKTLLRKRDPLETEQYWLQDDRDRLYQRIIEFHFKYDANESEARDWIQMAWKENIRSLSFHDEKLDAFWETITDELKAKRNPFDDP